MADYIRVLNDINIKHWTFLICEKDLDMSPVYVNWRPCGPPRLLSSIGLNALYSDDIIIERLKELNHGLKTTSLTYIPFHY